jgi:ZIP family zinc transporter
MSLSPTEIAILVLPGLATGLGGLGLLVVRRTTSTLLAALLGLTAGIMLAATFFSLLVPALDRGNLGEVLVGFVLGGAVIAVTDQLLPHMHSRLREGATPSLEEAHITNARRRGVMLLSALTIHNVPEGLAVGVALGAGGPELAVPIAVAIGIQNIPEGFAAAAPLLATGTPRARVAAIGAATGLVEPPAAIAAFLVVSVSSAILPAALAFAAAAMLYVIVDELLPEAAAHKHERLATGGFFIGFIVMMVLDVSLG